MYIVNTSFMVDPAIHDRWLESLRKHYLPLLAAQGFVAVEVFLDEDADHARHERGVGADAGLQVDVGDMPRYKRLVGELFEEYAATARDLFGDKLMWFNSLLKKVEY